MKPHVRAATGFFKSLGCTDILAKDIDDTFGKVKATYKGKEILVRVQLKHEWGTDEATPNGNHWNDDRYPYSSVQLITPRPTEGPDTSTHYLLMSGDFARCFLCPRTVVDNAMRGWATVDLNGAEVTVNTAIIENWTPKVCFFAKSGESWVKDTHNQWEAPKKVPMSADEFLKSI